MAMPFVADHSDRFGALALRLLADARVPVVSHGPAARLERGFLMKAATPAGAFYFKFVPDASPAELRSETAVLSALAARVGWVPRPYDFGGKPFFVATVWPRSGMAVVGTSCVEGLTLQHADDGLRREIAERVAEMHTVLAARPDVHGAVELRTDYQRLLQLGIAYRELLRRGGFAPAVEVILDRGAAERPLLPIHGDLRYENVIVEAGALRGIIDFSDARRSTREDELGRFFQYLVYSRGLTPGDLAPLLATYEDRAGYRADVVGLALSMAYHTLFRYVHDSRDADAASRAALDDRVRRILTGLARDPGRFCGTSSGYSG
ncbi:phosphotransferase [Streptomyces sp. NBC_01455]|uniref:phosphotransferase n=1 Tax=Streptomyces sp. NBC_01455 TaxID=2903874 RepID=UPI002E302D47|nr:phosphotransferase [Streptomyces sp. NBC_01455]